MLLLSLRHFIEYTQERLVRHFLNVADNVTKPIYLYDIPPRTQNHIEPETLHRLAGHENIIGIKDSDGKKETIEAYLNIAKEFKNFEVYSRARSFDFIGFKKMALGVHFWPF